MARARQAPTTVHDGVLVLDKPAGPTSHDVVDAVRRAVGHRRVGHTGTLDPAATGVLVMCLGRATKLVRFLQGGAKTYAARMLLGVTTDTQDADGRVLARRDAGHLDERQVCEVLVGFQGDILQRPPMVSAVRVDGERLHVRARRGEVVEREARPVHVESLVLDGFAPGSHPEVSFLVTCSAGTYVRTIAHDIGEALEVGGSLTALRRLANGPFTLADAVTPGDLEAAADPTSLVIDPVSAVRRALPVEEIVDDDVVARLVQGGRIDGPRRPGTFAVVRPDLDGRPAQLIGIYESPDEGGPARPALVWTRPEERT